MTSASHPSPAATTSRAEFFWRIPTHGDGRSVASSSWNRGEWKSASARSIAPGQRDGAPDAYGYIDYMAQVAKACELAGFDGALVPSSLVSDEPLMVAAALARETRTLRFMTAFQPGFITPAYAAKMGATLQRISGGRLEWNVITGGSAPAQLAYGDVLPHDDRYVRTGEWLDVIDGFWKGSPYDHKSSLYEVRGGGLTAPLSNTRKPGIYFSGASEPALQVAARHADYYLMWLEPLEQMQATMTRLNRMAAEHGRTPGYGLRVDVFARETEEEAWAEARRLWDGFDPTAPKKANPMTSVGGGDSVGAQRQAALRNPEASRFEDYLIGPNLWSGLGVIRPGPTIGIFGSYQQVADRLVEYVDAGFGNFILAANPHLEEALRIGEEVLPRVRAALAQRKAS
ncbi:LLM class flavin-dependent oxidoreductase [Pigmentiphaga litoralis]|uniref:Alkanesulfonate monooxygenase n=1 Tax=Pigmentiphaga litoralis TaxID=516702 RepID=A0A7Y9IYH8_9BURK|nr:LLM class flavin-dependent oxidoreductase [Pigmentiphaga litoralis]NYE26340.1 alkanesulfonate monooxygenase [Pigmentiphaga litoralis]NYE85460.1 alkanesulfonate monooxygenase [Pigmentiphaga litoralis]